jgi:hypothetical protein
MAWAMSGSPLNFLDQRPLRLSWPYRAGRLADDAATGAIEPFPAIAALTSRDYSASL